MTTPSQKKRLALSRAPRRRDGRVRGGVTLVEILVAMGIFVFGAVAIIGLFNLAGRAHSQTLDQDTTATLLNDIRSELRAMAARGYTAPAAWREPSRRYPGDRLLFRVDMEPIGGQAVEQAGIAAKRPVTYAVLIEILAADQLPGDGDIYQTCLTVRYNANP